MNCPLREMFEKLFVAIVGLLSLLLAILVSVGAIRYHLTYGQWWKLILAGPFILLLVMLFGFAVWAFLEGD